MEYKGFLASVDSYINQQMLGTIRKLRIEAEAVSFKNRRLEHNMVLNDLTLCNNVLYLRGVPEDEDIEDADRD
ncbi:hypothetical protein NC653_040426 [Populus alba x Populus x berolinensis]|uniref:Uncharacterized protein n=1 Tax=Populus alba x Populus x berolinensis TaxID=444605 RepID=A0AAD6LDM0_9ROSI|nr:hypothetical protein NC653_040426 [Populus alba x Populus x berolinensis]